MGGASPRRLHVASVMDGVLAAELVCKRPSCTRLVPSSKVGRPAQFCSPECREAFHREARLARAHLDRAIAAAAQYNVSVTPRPIEPAASSGLSDRDLRRLLRAVHEVVQELQAVAQARTAAVSLEAAWNQAISSYLSS